MHPANNRKTNKPLILASHSQGSLHAQRLLSEKCFGTYFKNNLIDYDTENNFSNWMYIAGVGTDPRGGRLFNLDKQKSLYDSNSEYRKKWL